MKKTITANAIIRAIEKYDDSPKAKKRLDKLMKQYYGHN